MYNKLVNKFYNPVLYFFLLPVVSFAFGSFFASQYLPLQLFMLVPFYFFILVNQLMENILLRIPQNDFELSKKLFVFLETVNLLLVLFFTWRYSLIAGLTLFLYTLIIQLQFLFSYYNLERTAAFIASFLKVMLLNGFSFYIHTHFISLDSFINYAAIFIPYFIYELTRIYKQTFDSSIILLVGLSYPIAIFLLSQTISYLSLLLLLTLPFFWPKSKDFSRKDAAIFLIGFSFFYGLLLASSLLV